MFPKVSLLKVFSFAGIKQSRVFSFLRMKAPLVKDTVELSHRVIKPPESEKALKYFQNRNIPIESLANSEADNEAYSLIQRYRKGAKDAKQVITSIKDTVDNAFHDNYDFDFNDKALNRTAFIYRFLCKGHFNEPLEFSPLEYHRIFRTIGESEYQALMNRQHIVAKSCNDIEVMVTNNPKGVNSCTKGKRYFVHFKDKINFDPLANAFFNLDENKLPYVHSHNTQSAEYYITGGYNIEDVEKIIDPATKKVIYSSKS